MRIVYTLILLIAVMGADAQNRDSLRRVQLDSVLSARYYRTPYDTNYVSRPVGRLT